ncbi:MAG: hypothetical protein H8E62_01780, partial [Planctomycetes bacterium]|nr:hypothetical protein [Planctomycetota bacterium]
LDRFCPSIQSLLQTPEALPYAENYLALVIKQAILNHFEWMIYERFRFELDQLCPSQRYFTRTIGLLIAFRMINSNSQTVDMLLRRGVDTMPLQENYDLIDYVKYAINAAEKAFDPRVVKSTLQWIRNNFQPGLIPMGAELEMSNLGFRAIHDEHGKQDPIFDGFRYFNEFALDVLMWKMGGYVDNHSGSHASAKRGFLELAPGRLNIVGELSKPATSDPWIMSQLIRETADFYPVNPHSLHLTFQLRRNQLGNQTVLPLNFVKCLFVLGGGTEVSQSGKLWVSRMEHDEIERNEYGEELIFARTSKRRSRLPKDLMIDSQLSKYPSYTHQYKFMRLERRANYEPLIMALKGIQLSVNPGDYLTSQQLAASRRLQKEYEELKAWAGNPTPISRRSKGRFLDAIYDGLMHEAHYKPYHKAHYIDWALGAIDLQLRLFNKKIEQNQSERSTFPVQKPR